MRRNNRFDSVSRGIVAPEYAIRLAEKRVGGMVEEFNWQQTFPGQLPGLQPRTTLLDLVVSAYLQGVNDTVEVATNRGWLNPSTDDAPRSDATESQDMPVAPV